MQNTSLGQKFFQKFLQLRNISHLGFHDQKKAGQERGSEYNHPELIFPTMNQNLAD